jgi:hypothetical protein
VIEARSLRGFLLVILRQVFLDLHFENFARVRRVFPIASSIERFAA